MNNTNTYNRIEARMELIKKERRKALITYITAGYPNHDKTVELIKAQDEAGVDVIEIGVPFSDPVADGPVIQNASYKSIINGTNINNTFDMIERARKVSQVPIAFMMYYNTIHFYGLNEFAQKCSETGVDGLIIPDLPYEEQEPIKEALKKVSGAPILIQLVSPVSKQRIPMLLKNAKGFVYCVSQMGVTGNGADFHKDVKAYLQEVKAVSDIPIMLGFGIRSAQDIVPLKEVIDGAIVGSAFITLMEENNFDSKIAKEYIAKFLKELNSTEAEY